MLRDYFIDQIYEVYELFPLVLGLSLYFLLMAFTVGAMSIPV